MAICYFIIRFVPTAEAFFTFWFYAYLLGLMGCTFGIMLAFLLPAHQVIMIVFGLSQVSFCSCV